jgi:hypothetical protein
MELPCEELPLDPELLFLYPELLLPLCARATAQEPASSRAAAAVVVMRRIIMSSP